MSADPPQSGPLKVGDHVRWSGGDRLMVVSGIDYLDRAGYFTHVTCRWFDDRRELQERAFPVEELAAAGEGPAAADGLPAG